MLIFMSLLRYQPRDCVTNRCIPVVISMSSRVDPVLFVQCSVFPRKYLRYVFGPRSEMFLLFLGAVVSGN